MCLIRAWDQAVARMKRTDIGIQASGSPSPFQIQSDLHRGPVILFPSQHPELESCQRKRLMNVDEQGWW